MKRFVTLQLILAAVLPVCFTVIFLLLNRGRDCTELFIPIISGIFFSLLLALSLSWLYINKLSSYIHQYAENARSIALGNFALSWPLAEEEDFRSLERNLEYMSEEIVKREGAILESERRLKIITCNVPGAVFQFIDRPNHQFYTEFFGDNITRIFGLDSNPETIFKEFCKHLPEEDRELFVLSVKEGDRAEGTVELRGAFY